ncbi:MAG: transaldolase family protein [Actinomycetota bacterium]
MVETHANADLEKLVRDLARGDFRGTERRTFPSDPAWSALRAAGTELWLDTGDLDAARALWTAEFSNLTTNNTLVKNEITESARATEFGPQVTEVGRAISEAAPALSLDELVIEVGFVLNCRVALRLIEAFDAHVSVELHPAMAHDAERSFQYGMRYRAVCPERFIIKVPLTPSGFLAARRLTEAEAPLNYTLGFSARQNVLAAAFSRPTYVNVFMGRLSQFLSENRLGDGKHVGEKTTMSTQMALLEGRLSRGWSTRLIGASIRDGSQVAALAGLDVFTMPPKAAAEFHAAYASAPQEIESQLGRDFEVHSEVPELLDQLWDVPDAIYATAEALTAQDTSGWTGAELAAFVRDRGAPDLFHQFAPAELAQIRAKGKIPSWEFWRTELETGQVALDDLMTVSALGAFETDQAALDQYIRERLMDAGLA